MARPRLTVAITWSRFEKAVHAVLIEALRRLAEYGNLPNGEEARNIWLHWLAVKAHHAIANSPEKSLPFSIFWDGKSQPEPGDALGDSRLLKRPDINCQMFNEQAANPVLSQWKYYTECKRLGPPENGRIFNGLYSQEGIARFITTEHAYAKGCRSAAMIGYMQAMPPGEILDEVNQFAADRNIPSLSKTAKEWRTKVANRLSQDELDREFETTKVRLTHFWLDLRHCVFDVPNDRPPDSASPDPPLPKSKKKRKEKKKTKTKKIQKKK